MNTESERTAIKFAAIEKPIVFKVQGKDSERYLNNRLSANIKNLTDRNPGTFAAALSVQGKTEGLFWVQKMAADLFILVSNGSDSSSVLQSLSRFKVADKVEFINLSEETKLIHLPYRSLNQINTENKLSNLNIILSYQRNRFGNLGLDLIINSKEVASLNCSSKDLEEIDSRSQLLLRLKAKIPEFGTEISPEYLLQESGLHGCYSTDKGCYVGQEVIQKIASFANTPAKLLAFKTKTQIISSTSLLSNSNDPCGTILSSAYDQKQEISYGFARIKSRFINDSFSARAHDIDLEFEEVFDFTI